MDSQPSSTLHIDLPGPCARLNSPSFQIPCGFWSSALAASVPLSLSLPRAVLPPLPPPLHCPLLFLITSFLPRFHLLSFSLFVMSNSTSLDHRHALLSKFNPSPSLISLGNFFELAVIADYNEERAKAVVSKVNDARFVAAQIDASDAHKHLLPLLYPSVICLSLPCSILYPLYTRNHVQ